MEYAWIMILRGLHSMLWFTENNEIGLTVFKWISSPPEGDRREVVSLGSVSHVVRNSVGKTV